jgi:hypothetical protein
MRHPARCSRAAVPRRCAAAHAAGGTIASHGRADARRGRAGRLLVEVLVALALLAVAGGALARLRSATVVHADRDDALVLATALLRDAAERLIPTACAPDDAPGRLGRIELARVTEPVSALRVQSITLQLWPHVAAGGPPRTLVAAVAGWCP